MFYVCWPPNIFIISDGHCIQFYPCSFTILSKNVFIVLKSTLLFLTSIQTAFECRVISLRQHLLISNVKFHRNTNPFQQQLQRDIKKIKASDKVFIPSDKTKKYYEVDRASHVELLLNNITQNYQVADAGLYSSINNEAKCIAKALKKREQ